MTRYSQFVTKHVVKIIEKYKLFFIINYYFLSNVFLLIFYKQNKLVN